MDADLQHPPELLPRLVEPILGGWADLVAGTRYPPRAGRAPDALSSTGALSSGLDGWWRRAVSGGTRSVVHLLIPRSRCLSDPMSGMFALDRSVIAGVDLRTNGFKILLEVAARGRPLRVHNLSYRFAERHAGESKARLAEGVRFVSHVARLLGAGPRLRALPDPVPVTSAPLDLTWGSPPSPLPGKTDGPPPPSPARHSVSPRRSG